MVIVLVRPKSILFVVRLINNHVVIIRSKVAWCTHVRLIDNRVTRGACMYVDVNFEF